MSKTLGIIAAVTLAATALLALKNKSAYQDELVSIKSEQQRAKSEQDELRVEKKRIVDANQATEDYKAKDQDDLVEGKLKDVNEKLSGATQSVVSLKQEFESNETKIVETKAVFEELPNPEELVPKVSGLRTELAALRDDISVKESRLNVLTAKESKVRTQVSSVRDVISLQSSGESYPSMRTSISSIYASLGFVVLNAGDKQGVVSGSILDVVRNSEVIGKLKVTAVEAGRSTANIVLDSVQAGTSLRTGDSVMAENKNSALSFQ